jgi:UDPglucose 6-dehydrogenase
MQIAIVGAGYVGLVTAAGLASSGHSVSVLEISPQRLGALRAGNVPFHEPGLQDLLTGCLAAGSLRVAGEARDAMQDAELVMICVGTPLSADGDADLSQVRSACDAIAEWAPLVPVAVRSTLPLGTTEPLAAWLRRDGLDGLVTNPEFLRQGTAVSDFLHPTRIVVGSDRGEENAAVAQMRSLYAGFEAPFIVTDFASAEMIKNAANAFLATKLSFINEVADLCEAYGADVEAVVRGMGLDPRIGDSYLRPGIGFGGSCLPKELANMVRLGVARELVVPLMRGAARTNEERPARIAERLAELVGGLEGRRVAVLGLTFKPHTDDTRYSPSLALVGQLVERGATVIAHDPVLAMDAPIGRSVQRADQPEAAVAGADLVVLATEWPMYQDLDWQRLASEARRPVMYDGRGVLDRQALAKAGWTVAGIGRAVLPATVATRVRATLSTRDQPGVAPGSPE